MRMSGIIGALVLSAAIPTAGSATDMRYAVHHPPGSSGAISAELFAQRVGELSDGEINVEVFPGTLLTAPELSDGLANGVVEVAFVIPPYAPASYPSNNMVGELTMMWNMYDTNRKAGIAWVGALSEFVTQNCPSCVEEFAARNSVFTVGTGAEYVMICTKPVASEADLQGLRVRAPGAHWARWVAAFGGTSVSLPAGEAYEGLSQGIIDCTLNGLAELIDLRLIDVAKYVTLDVPGGGFGAAADVTFNKEVWEGFTPEERTIMLKSAAAEVSNNSWGYHVADQNALEAAQKEGIEAVAVTPELQAKTDAFVEEDLRFIAGKYADEYGLENTQEMVETMVSLFEKWIVLVQDVESAQDLEELLWTESMSKIDVETYGVN